ncbi:MAG: PhnD/SsuA/transferrin family substrate-binding protein [Nitrospinae bacterium]|nr:PhnD/SsuA/transferrin family substrate-binding protein [Nitrospinota bacterium]
MARLGPCARRWGAVAVAVAVAALILAPAPLCRADNTEPVRIGVLSFRPAEQMLEQWTPLAELLEETIPGRTFTVEALGFPELERRVADHRLDFVYTNPAHYILLARRYGVTSPLATVLRDGGRQARGVFGGVIICRSDNRAIGSMTDLRGKRVAATGETSLGGYLIQQYELQTAGIDVETDALPSFTGMPHDRVVAQVLEGKADVGFVRTGVLEGMRRDGALDMRRIRVLNRQNLPGYPYALSTRLYPEWPFAALPHVHEDLARQVAVALFRLEESPAVAGALGIHGFGIPADYTPVGEMLRTLRVPPFDRIPSFTRRDVFIRYRTELLTGAAAGGALLLLGLALLYANRKLVRQRGVILAQRQALAHSEERWKFALEGAGDGVWDWNVATGETFFSHRWKEMFGFADDGSAGSVEEWRSRLHPDDRVLRDADLQRHFRGETPLYQNEHRIRCRDGSYKWILERGVVLTRTPEGAPLRMIGTHSDITQRKQMVDALAASHRDYRLIADYTNDWEIWISPDGAHRHVSPSCLSITGYPRQTFIDIPEFILSIIHPDDQDAYRAHLETHHLPIEKADRAPFRFRIIRADGAVRWMDHSCQPVFDERGGWMGTRASNTDVTELVEARTRMEEATRLKDQFVGLVAHDLRSPLSAMLGLLGILADRAAPSLSEQDRTILHRLIKSGNDILATINDLLDISRLKSGQLTPQPRFFNVRAAVGTVMDTLRFPAESKGITLVNDLPETLRWHADPTLFGQVAQNLVSNAIKFCRAGDTVTVFAPEGAGTKIAFRDTGVGIEPERAADLFRPEVKTSTLGTAGERGTGLGLPFCRDIMRAHGGEIDVVSTPEEGTTFTLRTPVTLPRVLIVDDEPTMRFVPRIVIERLGFVADEAVDGSEALVKLQGGGYHLLLTDLSMPNMDGFALIRRVRGDRTTKDMPVFVLTASGGEVREEVLRLGVDDFIEKPVNPDDLSLRIRRLFG